ncbi:MAG: rod shape-determining protein MreC [Flavobacteriales bacterium]|nr:rod shape-determining protein MreC [Flavobacteriales bacterium]
MRNIFIFILRYHVLITFVIFEILTFSMLINSNFYNSSRFLSSSNFFIGKSVNYFNNFQQYFFLKDINEILIEENTSLKNKLNLKFKKNNLNQKTEYIEANVIKNSTSLKKNYITINKGSIHGIEPGMGVCNHMGVVGIIRDISSNFSTIISILNTKSLISTRINNTNHFGELVWNGISREFAQLNSIEKYVDIAIGDSLFTNSYSNIFPEDILIGTINRFSILNEENFYNIEVNLSVDFSNIYNVYVIKNNLKNEREKLESGTYEK